MSQVSQPVTRRTSDLREGAERLAATQAPRASPQHNEKRLKRLTPNDENKRQLCKDLLPMNI